MVRHPHRAAAGGASAHVPPVRTRTRLITLTIICALASTFEATARGSVTLGHNFVGADRGDVLVLNGDNYTRTPAPDVNGGVGPDHVVLFIKGAYRAWDKRTGSLAQSINDVQFWNQSFANNGLTYQTTQTRGPSDPRILYDRLTQRWFAVGIDRVNSDNGVLNIAVSNGPNPTGADAWRGFTFPVNGGWFDFPTVGLDDRGMHVSAPIFNAAGSLQQTQFSFFPRAGLLADNPSAAGAISFQLGSTFVAAPAVAMDPRPGNLPILNADNNTLRFGRIGDIPNEDIFFRNVTPQVAFTNGGIAPQPFGVPGVEVGDGRIRSSVVLQDEEVWGVGHFGNQVKWWRLNANTGSLLQQGTIGLFDPTFKLFFPSIAVDDFGNVVIGMNVSSPNFHIGSMVAAGRTVDGVTTFDAPVFVGIGEDVYFQIDDQGRNRWGDYSTTVFDPTDPNVFWTFQEIPKAPRFVPELNRTVFNNRAIQITQVFVPEPVAWVTIPVAGVLIWKRPPRRRGRQVRRNARAPWRTSAS